MNSTDHVTPSQDHDGVTLKTARSRSMTILRSMPLLMVFVSLIITGCQGDQFIYRVGFRPQTRIHSVRCPSSGSGELQELSRGRLVRIKSSDEDVCLFVSGEPSRVRSIVRELRDLNRG